MSEPECRQVYPSQKPILHLRKHCFTPQFTLITGLQFHPVHQGSSSNASCSGSQPSSHLRHFDYKYFCSLQLLVVLLCSSMCFINPANLPIARSQLIRRSWFSALDTVSVQLLLVKLNWKSNVPRLELHTYYQIQSGYFHQRLIASDTSLGVFLASLHVCT